MIPYILHQTWRSDELPCDLRSYRETWRSLNPGLDCRLYTDEQCREFVRREYAHHLPVYDRLPFAVQRADFFRYLVVHRFGGLYADVDMECLRPFDAFFALRGALFSVERHITGRTQRRHDYEEPYQIANCIFMAEPADPFLAAIIERIVEITSNRRTDVAEMIEDLTGPRMLTRLYYERKPQSVSILQQAYWLPWTLYPNLPLLNRNMFARHHFMGSWKRGIPRRGRWADRDLPPNPFPKTMFHPIGARDGADRAKVP